MKKLIWSTLMMVGGVALQAASQNAVLDPGFEKVSKQTAVGRWKQWAQQGCRVEASNGSVVLINEAKNKVSTVTQEVHNLQPGGEYVFEIEARSSKPRAWGKVTIQITKNGKKIKLADTKPLMAKNFSPVKLKFKLPAEVSSITITLLRSTWWGAQGAVTFRKPVLKAVEAKKKVQ